LKAVSFCLQTTVATLCEYLCYLTGSDAKENFVPEHPVKYKPVDSQSERSDRHRLEGGAKDVEHGHAQIDAKATLNEVFKKVGHQISCDRIHTDDDKRKRETCLFLDVYDP
jgi:hypothetical protein